MASSLPSRSIDPDPNLSDHSRHSASLSSSSRTVSSAVPEPAARKPQAAKARRRSATSRSTPYASPALSRVSRSSSVTVAVVSNAQDSRDGYDLSLLDINMVSDSPRRNKTASTDQPFENSSGDDNEVYSSHAIPTSWSDSRRLVLSHELFGTLMPIVSILFIIAECSRNEPAHHFSVEQREELLRCT